MGRTQRTLDRLLGSPKNFCPTAPELCQRPLDGFGGGKWGCMRVTK